MRGVRSASTSLDATHIMALTACACWERSIGWPSASCVFKCCKVTAAPAPGKALDQGALDGAQPIGATEITFDIGDKAIECIGRASAAVELAARKQLRQGCARARRAPPAACSNAAR